MKIALYIEDGLEQIVLTPETETERGILGKLDDDSRQLEIKRGSFYQTNGGWTRFAPASFTGGMYDERRRQDDRSTMIVLRQKLSPAAPADAPEEASYPQVVPPIRDDQP